MRFLACSRFRRVPSYDNSEDGPNHSFPGKFDGPLETPVHLPNVEAGRPDEDVNFLATKGGADELLAGFHCLRQGLVEQEPAENLFQLVDVLDWRWRGARREVLKLNLAADWLHLFSGFACGAQPSGCSFTARCRCDLAPHSLSVGYSTSILNSSPVTLPLGFVGVCHSRLCGPSHRPRRLILALRFPWLRRLGSNLSSGRG